MPDAIALIVWRENQLANNSTNGEIEGRQLFCYSEFQYG